MSFGFPIAALLAASLVPGRALAVTAREILDEAIAVNRAREPKDVSQRLRMTNVRGGSVQFVRELETFTKLYGDDRAKVATFFVAPADIKGVGFLAWSEPGADDVQWLYLPKIHRVRQIGPSARQQSFQDSVFSYEDLELFAEILKWTDEDAESRLVSEAEPVDGIPCLVIELRPARSNVSYGRIVSWLHQPDATVRRFELYDRATGALAKEATFSRMDLVAGIPVAGLTELADLRSGLRTLVEIFETRFDAGLDEEIFTPWYLERAAR